MMNCKSTVRTVNIDVRRLLICFGVELVRMRRKAPAKLQFYTIFSSFDHGNDDDDRSMNGKHFNLFLWRF